MQIAQDNATAAAALGAALPEEAGAARAPYSEYKVIRRNGAVVGFEPAKISVAMTKAFLAVNGAQGAASARIRELVAGLTEAVVGALIRRQPQGGTFHIEDIQDQVELALMRSGEHDVARAYVLYREERAKARAQEKTVKSETGVQVVDAGVRKPLDRQALARLIESACQGLAGASPQAILESTLRDLYDGVPMEEVRKSAVLAARALIEKEPAYGYVTARLLLNTIRLEVLGEEVSQADMQTRYATYFPQCIKRGIAAELLDPELGRFDLERLGRALQARRDLQFNYLGLQTLYDRYFLHVGGRRIELPQAFFMRVAMGLALREKNREARAIEFYDVLSSFDFMSSTPTLFNSGTLRSQLSSCYLTTVSDNLEGIYEQEVLNLRVGRASARVANSSLRRALPNTRSSHSGCALDTAAKASRSASMPPVTLDKLFGASPIREPSLASPLEASQKCTYARTRRIRFRLTVLI
jgi:ribonucleoside-diphosphate reductase alpha chain